MRCNYWNCNDINDNACCDAYKRRRMKNNMTDASHLSCLHEDPSSTLWVEVCVIIFIDDFPLFFCDEGYLPEHALNPLCQHPNSFIKVRGQDRRVVFVEGVHKILDIQLVYINKKVLEIVLISPLVKQHEFDIAGT
mmetsp:Transcript_17/g.19  ORF Transcript_17/g.19 Transcript_17/m.19 type:complete len:136 (-) Transcript_17:86-493(-)